MKKETIVVPQGDWRASKVEERKARLISVNKEALSPERMALASLEDELAMIDSLRDRRSFSILANRLIGYIESNIPKRDFLMIPLFETAVKHGWTRRLEKANKDRLKWDGRDWMGHWYDAAITVSLETNLLCFYHSRLWRWLERGRFDHNLWPLVPVMEKHKQSQAFHDLVAQRFAVARQTGQVVTAEQFELL